MFLSGKDNFGYNQLNTYIKNNYVVGMDRYPQDLPVVIKLLNKYITESGKNKNFRKISRKGQTELYFTQTQEKDVNYNKKTKI